MNGSRTARSGLIALAGWLTMPALVWADAPSGSGPQTNGPEPVGQLLGAIMSLIVVVAILVGVIAVLVGVGWVVARFDGRPGRGQITVASRGP